MTIKNQESAITELTPATLEQMPITQKINAYEEILNEQSSLDEKLLEKRKKIEKVIEPTGKMFSEIHQKSDLRVFKKRNADPKIVAFAACFGNNLSNILASGTTSDYSLEEYLGDEAYTKLKKITEEYSISRYGEKNVDETASAKIWNEYTKLITEFRAIQDSLEIAGRKLNQANQYVAYVQKLAEVANKTNRLASKSIK